MPSWSNNATLDGQSAGKERCKGDQGCNLTSEVKKYTNGMKTIFLKYGPKLSLVMPNPPEISRSKPCRAGVPNLIRPGIICNGAPAEHPVKMQLQ